MITPKHDKHISETFMWITPNLLYEACRGSGRGPQPGGGMHPPNLRGWLPGEVQAILQIYPWSKNTRTHQELVVQAAGA